MSRWRQAGAVSAQARTYRAEDAGALLAAFEEAYRGLYSRVIPGIEIEVLSWVLLLSGPAPAAEGVAPAEPPPSYPEPARRRAVFDPMSADFVEVAIYERAALAPASGR